MTTNNIKILATDELRSRAEKIATHSRKIDALFLEHIAEIERRKAYLNWGFKSFYEFIVTEYRMSGASAYRRMQAAYALLAVPEIKREIESGALNLGQITLAHKAIKQEQKINGPVQLHQRKQVFKDLCNKTARETEKILDQKFESFALMAPPTERHRRDDSVELNLRLPEDVFKKLMRIKELYSHSIPDGNWIAVVDKMADDVLAKRDPLKKRIVARPESTPHPSLCDETQEIAQGRTELKVTAQPKVQPSTPLNEPKDSVIKSKDSAPPNSANRKALRPTVRRFIFQRDQICQHKFDNGKLCGSKFQLEVDHIHPKFAGGSDQLGNLRLLCRLHNQERYRLGI